VLLEAFDAEDLQVAHELLAARKGHSEAILIGVNCRDLDTLAIELPRLRQLAEHLPAGFTHVAESGVTSLEDVRSVVDIGYHMALVGTTLMHADDPRKLLGQMLAAGRERALAARTGRLGASEA
jgi:indole-3-glycerol phosphate synthase